MANEPYFVIAAVVDGVGTSVAIAGPSTELEARRQMSWKFREAKGLPDEVDVQTTILHREKTRAKAQHFLDAVMFVVNSLRPSNKEKE